MAPVRGRRTSVQARRPALGHVLRRQREVCLRRYSPDGSEVALQRARFNFLAEGSLESQAYHCDAVAIEASTALAFPMAAFQQAIDESPDFRSRWISHLMCEVRRSRAQCERLTLRTPPPGCCTSSNAKAATASWNSPPPARPGRPNWVSATRRSTARWRKWKRQEASPLPAGSLRGADKTCFEYKR